ncbi:MAG: class I SAM-dependent methyltransferase [Methanobacteriaceae archaeon]|nr:class I SAM-dependent methyltransferase [Methanobacteriaceae archaeon]
MKIEDKLSINDIDWDYIWKRELGDKKPNNKKDWNDVAEKFGKWIAKDDYPEKLLNYIKVTKNDTVMDLGCGEGTITIPLAKKCSHLLAVDKSDKMLDLIQEKMIDEGLSNIITLRHDILKLNKDNIGQYDVIVASRSISGAYEMKEVLSNLNDIAKKYVYITFYGPNNRRETNKALEAIGKKNPKKHADYSIIFNLLVSMGIHPNVVNLECESVKGYANIDEAIERFNWRVGNVSEKEREKLDKHFRKSLVQNSEGMWENPNDKGDWVLIWWKKEL